MRRRNTLWDELRRMQEEMDRLFGSFLDATPQGDLGAYALMPGTAVEKSNYRKALADITQTDKEIIATVELPGVNKEDIEINATDEGVEIKVEHKEENKEENKKKGTYWFERSYAGFYRYIPLPDGADTQNIDASYKNGVLELRIPKKEDKKKSKRIAVK
ncbi:Hsp20/alpha crystallin family protein [Candidatus Woesearchaeota archaeon]|nr:MAG: Hsp20/alpha crystallin family protein [Candidatus Woesearchaeota archaeon]